MKHNRSFLFYLITFLGIFLMPGCKVTESMSVGEYNHKDEIGLVVMQDGSYYQVHYGQQVKIRIESDSLLLIYVIYKSVVPYQQGS